jgi:hypothetical protein
VFIAGFLVGAALGLWVGVWVGGWRAVLKVSQVAHRDLMRRAGLRD